MNINRELEATAKAEMSPEMESATSRPRELFSGPLRACAVAKILKLNRHDREDGTTNNKPWAIDEAPLAIQNGVVIWHTLLALFASSRRKNGKHR
jgi:hypothetical protein